MRSFHTIDKTDDLRRELARIPVREPLRGALTAGASTSESGAGGSSGCCCNSANCVDLCDAIESDVITTCSACPDGALKNYTVSIGGNLIGLADPVDTGFFRLTWDSACTWLSASFGISGGTYKLALITDDVTVGVPYIEVQYISGSDPLKITDGYHRIRWVFNGSIADYSCLCNMQFKLIEVSKVYKPKGLNALVCLLPLEVATLPPTCPQVLNPATGENVQPCLGSFDFPSIDVSDLGYGGSTAVNVPLDFVIEIETQCRKVGFVYLVPPSHPPDDSDAVYVTVSIWYAGGVADLGFVRHPSAVDGTGDSAEYTLAPGSWVIGSNTLTRTGTSTHFPATITVVLTDCHFSSSHHDYGYGCGGSVPGGGGCGGAGCEYTAFDSAGTQGGSVGPWTWGGCVGACPEGCVLPGPPITPPTSGSDTYSVSCVSV